MKTQQLAGTIVATVLVFWLTMNLEKTCLAQATGVVVDERFLHEVEPCPVAGFRVLGGDWKLNDGVVSVGPDRGPKLVLQGATVSTGRVGTEVFFADKRGGNIGLLVKVSDADVGADKWNGYEVSLYADKQVLHLARHRQNYEPICHVPCEVPVGEWVSLVVETTEATLKIYVQGKLIHSYEDEEHPLATGQIALRPWQREARYRNLWFEKDGERTEVAFFRPEGWPAMLDGWTLETSGTAKADLSLNAAKRPGELASQQIGFATGRGEVCLMKGQRVSATEGDVYHGYVWAKSVETPTELELLSRVVCSSLTDNSSGGCFGLLDSIDEGDPLDHIGDPFRTVQSSPSFLG